jgi:hypothetical protein
MVRLSLQVAFAAACFFSFLRHSGQHSPLRPLFALPLSARTSSRLGWPLSPQRLHLVWPCADRSQRSWWCTWAAEWSTSIGHAAQLCDTFPQQHKVGHIHILLQWPPALSHLISPQPAALLPALASSLAIRRPPPALVNVLVTTCKLSPHMTSALLCVFSFHHTHRMDLATTPLPPSAPLLPTPSRSTHPHLTSTTNTLVRASQMTGRGSAGQR